MREVVLVPTYHRPELLFYCLSLIRHFEPDIPIAIFPDRGSLDDLELVNAEEAFSGIQWHWVPKHEYGGNTFNVMEAYRWAYNEGFEQIYLIEDDVMIHPDFFKWHRAQHDDDENEDLFASMAWIFNRHAPIEEMDLRQPWYYSIGVCFQRSMLEYVVRHSSPLYYADMAGYVRKNFKDSPLNDPQNLMHYEQDGLIQRVLDQMKLQTVSPGIAKCTHLGFYGYNRGWECESDIFANTKNFEERIARLGEFLKDDYHRVEVFGRAIVEREIGKPLKPRENRYRIELPGGWSTEFKTERQLKTVPAKINSAPIPPEAKLVLLS